MRRPSWSTPTRSTRSSSPKAARLAVSPSCPTASKASRSTTRRKAPFAPFFTPFFTYLETASKDDAAVERELREYLDSPTVNERTDDDKSLVLAVRR